MTGDQIRDAVRAQPFRPFTLKTVSGTEYLIDHSELLVLSPGGRTAYIFHHPDSAAIVDVLMVESIHLKAAGDKKGRRRSA